MSFEDMALLQEYDAETSGPSPTNTAHDGADTACKANWWLKSLGKVTVLRLNMPLFQ
jgi:hypothetical protein